MVSIYTLPQYLITLFFLKYPTRCIENTELQLNKANSFDTEAPFLDLDFYIANGIVSSKIYDKRNCFDFEIVYFRFLGGDVLRCQWS